MSETVRVINNEDQFNSELQKAGSRLVIADFSAKWCGPCQRIAPYFKLLSHQYGRAVFLKVDVDQCQDMAVNERISAMPTFVFYRNKSPVDRLQGADPMALETKIQKYYDPGADDLEGDDAEPDADATSAASSNLTGSKSKEPSISGKKSKEGAGPKKGKSDEVKSKGRHFEVSTSATVKGKKDENNLGKKGSKTHHSKGGANKLVGQ